jgi:hypothetical protein
VGSVSLWAVDRDAFLAAVGGSRQSVRWVDEHARDHYR